MHTLIIKFSVEMQVFGVTGSLCIVGWRLSCVGILLTDGDSLHITTVHCCSVSGIWCEKGSINARYLSRASEVAIYVVICVFAYLRFRTTLQVA